MRPTLGNISCDAGVIVESWRLWESISSVLSPPPQRISDWQLDSDFFLQTVEDKKVAFVIAQGSSIVADASERLIGSGAKRILRLGTCGGLQYSQNIGGLVVSTAAIRDEGTSRFYLPETTPALSCFYFTQKIVYTLQQASELVLQVGPTWSTDGRWRETDERVIEFSELNFLAVDMETASLFSVAMRNKVKAGSISAIADIPINHLGQQFKGINANESDWKQVCTNLGIALPKCLEVLLD